MQKELDTNMTDRVYYLDAMRGILMILGIFLHSAAIFHPQKVYLAVHSEKTTQVAFYLYEIIHIFRMPVFFIISGYFVFYTLKKYGPDQFIKLRSRRIFIPLITTALTLNVIQAILSFGRDWQNQYFNGEWIVHLWFLWNLLFYFVFIYIGFKFFENKVDSLINKISEMLLKFPDLLMISVLSLLSIVLYSFSKFFPTDFLGINIKLIFYYLPYFLFGILLFAKQKLLDKFTHINPAFSLFFTLIAYWIFTSLQNYDGIIWTIANLYFKNLSLWFASSFIFYIFIKLINKPSRLFYFLANASYTIYLFHFVFVIGFSLILIDLGVGGGIGLFILITSVSIITTLIHIYLISKIKLLRFLFNGK